MLLDFGQLVDKYDLCFKIKRAILIGAHYGQELPLFRQCGWYKTICFEPLKRNFEILRKNATTEDILYNCALGTEEKLVEMFVDNNVQASSSILEPNKHLEQNPEIQFPTKEIVRMEILDNFDISTEYNFINIDVQGYELEVLKGGQQILNQIDFVYSEVNREDVYNDCCRVEELDEFLLQYRLQRVETCWCGIWGDAFYARF